MSLIGKNGRYLGGGIDLLDEMKQYIVSPDVLVNVKEIGYSQSGISIQILKQPGGDSCKLGASVTVAEIAAHPELKSTLPGLVEAASEIGSPQIRNVATVAGNLLQH